MAVGRRETKAGAVRRRTGAAALVESIARSGTEIAFGYPGSAVLDIFDCFRDAPFRFVLGRHEQGCVHMADGYARATGRPGVCIVTSGPGATNAVTGLATANLDGVPLVVITGQVPLGQIGTDAFQEADTQGIVRAVTKHSFLVQSADEIPETVAQAFYIATHGKPGPVVIDVPKDCQQQLTAATFPERVELRAYRPDRPLDRRALARFARLVNAAKRPVVYAGGGVVSSGAAQALADFAHRAGLPVATTLMGLGCFDQMDPLSLGFAGMHGTIESARAIDAADLVIALGVRFSDRITGKVSAFAKGAKIIHVDCDPASINKNVRVALGIVADVRELLEAALPLVKPADRGEWLGEVAAFRGSRQQVEQEPIGAIRPEKVIRALDRLKGEDSLVVTDVGQHQMWAAQNFVHRRPRHFLTSGGMGTMGFGIPAAIGAAIGRPGCRVIAVCGDGGAQMTFEELVVAVENRLDIVVVIVNNGCLGMVRQWQELFYGGNYSQTVLQRRGMQYLPDFVKLAEAHGAWGMRVTRPSALVPALRRALAERGPTVVEVVVDPTANVYPMIPAGATIREMRLK